MNPTKLPSSIICMTLALAGPQSIAQNQTSNNWSFVVLSLGTSHLVGPKGTGVIEFKPNGTISGELKDSNAQVYQINGKKVGRSVTMTVLTGHEDVMTLYQLKGELSYFKNRNGKRFKKIILRRPWRSPNYLIFVLCQIDIDA
ncbi:MAG: hypothetical protein IPQ13_06855 [Holophagaceae bacterium]|nr:hypothetical protein [Holophagaceae bacterium]